MWAVAAVLAGASFLLTDERMELPHELPQRITLMVRDGCASCDEARQETLAYVQKKQRQLHDYRDVEIRSRAPTTDAERRQAPLIKIEFADHVWHGGVSQLMSHLK